MRRSTAVTFALFLSVAAPAMAQVIIQTPNGAATQDEMRAQRDRADARRDMSQAHRDAAMGDYQGAADAQRDARQDMHAAHREQERAQDESTTVVIGR